MTNEDIHAAVVALKEATEAGFQRNDKRFDGIGPRLERVVTHVLRLETRVEAVDVGLKDVHVRPPSRFRWPGLGTTSRFS